MTLADDVTGTCVRELDVDKVLLVAPQRITYRTLRRFCWDDYQGRIIGGDWDLLERALEEPDLPSTLAAHDPMQVEEVTVSIGRHGDLLLCDGGHALFSARLAGAQTVPAKVAVRHPQWLALRRALLQHSFQNKGTVYQKITHPDLADISARHDCDARFTMIKEHMSAKQGRLLDIGANLGYFCHRFEEEGFVCYAVENHPDLVRFLKRLRRAENRRFEIIAESVFEWHGIRNIHFDVTLALNIFHHFLRTKEGYERCVELLQCLQTKELYFESYAPGERTMEGAYRDYSPEEFVEFLLRYSTLTTADRIGFAKRGRPVYKLC